MRRPVLVLSLILACPALAVAQGTQTPINLLPPATPHETAPAVPPADKPLLDEPSPSFQPLRPAPTEVMPAVPAEQQRDLSLPDPTTAPAPMAAPDQPTTPDRPMATTAAPAPVPMTTAPPDLQVPAATPTVPVAPPVAAADTLPGWALAVLVLLGAFLAALFGILTALLMRRAETKARRRAVAATLATELETRRQAFEAVPLPPNVEAGVSFVSSVTSLAGIDAGFRSTQGNLHLLPEKLAAHVSVHYAAVQRVSDFVKGQSLAAAVRMLQANRLGGHPCPDAGTMREAHVELGAAFRGLDKLVQVLRGQG